jgi:hypothetical protein
MSKEQRKMLNTPDKLESEQGITPLTALFRGVLKHFEVDITTWNSKLTNYLRSPISGTPNNAKDIGQERSNFNRAIARRAITFKTFHRAIQILGPKKYSMGITMVMGDGRVVELTTKMYANEYAKFNDLKTYINPETVEDTIIHTDYDEDEDDLEEDLQELGVQIAGANTSSPRQLDMFNQQPIHPANTSRLSEIGDRYLKNNRGA